MIYEVIGTIISQDDESQVMTWTIDDEIKYNKQPRAFREYCEANIHDDIAVFDNCTATLIREFDRVIITYSN